MTSHSFNTADELSRLLAEGLITEDALQSITGIKPEQLRSLLSAAKPGTAGFTADLQSLSNDESSRLSTLVVHLTEGLRIGDDERLKGILEGLTIQCRLTVANIAKLTGLDVSDLEAALLDPQTIPVEKRYELAIKGSYLVNAVNQARGRR